MRLSEKIISALRNSFDTLLFFATMAVKEDFPGMALTIANMFDLSVKVEDKAELYLLPTSNNKEMVCSIEVKDEAAAFAAARELVEILPQNNKDDASQMSGDDAARAVAIDGLTGKALVETLADNGKFVEIYAQQSGIVTGFA